MTDPLDWDGLVRETKRRREQDGLTQLRHAQLAGVSRDTIRSFDKYERSISLEKATAILRVVGLVSEVDHLRHDAREHADFVRRGLERWDDLVRSLPAGHPSRFPHGRATYDVQLRGEPGSIDGSGLLAMLAEVPPVSGWGPFYIFSKRALQPTVEPNGEVECWVGRPDDDKVFADAAHADYWRASTRGHFLLLRGYQEDGDESSEPGSFLDVALPLWRAADFLDHAVQVAHRFPGQVERVVAHVAWEGLAGRRLINWSRPTAMLLSPSEHRARVATVSNAVTVKVNEGDLEGNLQTLLLPLYAAFDFDLGIEDVRNELARREAKSGAIARAR